MVHLLLFYKQENQVQKIWETCPKSQSHLTPGLWQEFRLLSSAEYWRIDAFEPWCWRRLLRVPWTVRRSNQSILKEISPEYSLEGLMLKLKLLLELGVFFAAKVSFGHLMWRADSLGKTLMLGKIEARRRRGWQRMRWLDDITDSMDMSLCNSGKWWWIGKPGVLQSMRLQGVRHNWATELNWGW